jgi:7-keto-8-aminopelargonate synthetase-like enzyme
MVDEAHATGLYGPQRRGLAEALGVTERIEIQMGTLGKALGAAGGYICGSWALIDYLVNRARTFIFSTAPVPAAAAAATAAIEFVQSNKGQSRCDSLWLRVAELEKSLNTCASHAPSNVEVPTLASAIIPIMIGNESAAMEAAAALKTAGVFVPAVRYPTVARGQARLRLTVSAAHSPADIVELLDAFKSVRLEQWVPQFSL